MNIILTYKQTSEFDEVTQKQVDQLQFSHIPEMRIIETEIGVDEDMIIQYTIPYQANVGAEDLESIKAVLNQFGVVDIIGTWNDNGSKIECDIQKYCDALKDFKTFETAVFLNGVDYTGKEDTFINEIDDDGNVIQPSRNTFNRVKESKRPTLAQAKLKKVSAFSKDFNREL